MINKELELILEATIKDVRVKNYEYLTIEHLLYAVLHDESGASIIVNCGGNISRMKQEIEKYFEANIPKIQNAPDVVPRQTIGFHRTIQRALNHVRSAGKEEVDSGDILAAIFYEQDSYAALKKSKIFSLDMGALLAGTRFRGDFEARLKSTIKSLEAIQGAILFIDEIHTVVGAGATSGGSMDASNILKPILNSGKLRCIGASTYEEYKNYFEKDRALSRRFQKIELQEPDVEDTIKILEGLKSYYEEFHGVGYTKSALKAAAELSAKYINDKYLPDKAIDVIDEAGAVFKLGISKKIGNTIGVPEIERTVAGIAKIPAQTISTSETRKLMRLDTELKDVVFGQDKAIVSLVSAIKRIRAGMASPDKPIGSFLFLGPTGVGKTSFPMKCCLES
ncbi:MAG: AAA family ATPase [Nitrospirae bacterium]|nr:AAA family ATPase [Nitrospirota bacterium]